MRLCFLMSAMFLSCSSLAAEITILHSYKFQQKVFDLDPGRSCQIKRFTLINTHQELKEVNGTGTDHFTSMAALIDTSKPDCVKDYGVVQFVQGCVSNQEYNKSNGQLTSKHFGTIRTSREKDIYFAHPRLEVDSLNQDPLYASKSTQDEGERLGWYYVSKTPLRLKDNRSDILADDYLFQRPSSRFFLEQTKDAPTQVYVADLPSQAAFHSDEKYPVALITTPSLDFKTCVYEMKDIPSSGSPASPETAHALGGPLACYQWSHKFEFNPKKLNFDEVITEGTDSFCLSPTPTPSANLSF